MIPKSIGVIGGGVVGKATARCYLEHYEVRVYDIVKEKATHTYEEALACDLVFVCLPTPMKAGQFSCDLSHLDAFFLGVKGTDKPLVLKSTVPIGTTVEFRRKYNLRNLIHSPEFLTARCAITDAQVPAVNIIGSGTIVLHNKLVYSDHSILLRVLAERFPGTPLILTTSGTSEAIKLVLNGFFAVKVAYFNECQHLADALDLNWDTLMKGVLADGRIAHSHTKVPGPDGKFGFGGECLPKDLANLITCIEQGYPERKALVTEAAYKRNENIDRRRI